MISLSFTYVFFLCSVKYSSSLTGNDINAASNNKSLEFFAVIARHGSRSPLITYPNDPYPYTNRHFWPNGPNELSNLGKEQLYHTGQYLRVRYNGFLDPLYNPNASEVRYNPYNRDYMSSACLTAGLYPPILQQIWNPYLMWQPVVQSLREFDVCDLATNDMCPKFKVLFNAEVEEFNKNSTKNKDLLDYVSDNAGQKFTNLSDMYFVYDTLLMQVQNGYKLPEWTKKVFPFTLRPLATNYLIRAYGGSKELIQLGAGPELKYISNMLTMKANCTYDATKKIYIEAAHDCTLISLLRAFGNRDPYLEIHTGAYLIFELHYLPPNYIVQIFYFRTSHDVNPQTIEISGCPNPCSLTEFNKFVDTIHPPNWDKACQV